eukprot:3470178-Amphidinium_carterae.1
MQLRSFKAKLTRDAGIRTTCATRCWGVLARNPVYESPTTAHKPPTNSKEEPTVVHVRNAGRDVPAYRTCKLILIIIIVRTLLTLILAIAAFNATTADSTKISTRRSAHGKHPTKLSRWGKKKG